MADIVFDLGNEFNANRMKFGDFWRKILFVKILIILKFSEK